MFAGLNECLLMRARESEQELRSELDALKNKRPDKKELRASEKALARLNVDLKAALENAAEQKKTIEQLSSQLSEKQVEVKRLQREISNGVRKLKKIVNDTPFSKTSQDEGSAKTSAFEALADSAAKLVESEKKSKKQNALKLAQTEEAVRSLQVQLTEAEEACRLANEKHQKARNTITHLEARITEIECKVECGVCNERDVDVVFHCGHTMCCKCSEKIYLRGDDCPYCRRRIGYKKKLCLGS
ncbi:hypothetical protein AAVH_18668 [Aphelenchoides avenae]|nr:hypothetical protein AAVH_18668 [Aphelenchus avenae]